MKCRILLEEPIRLRQKLRGFVFLARDECMPDLLQDHGSAVISGGSILHKIRCYTRSQEENQIRSE